MSADDVRHRAQSAEGGVGVGRTGVGGDIAVLGTVAARIPAEYREAYLEGFARVRADLDDTAGRDDTAA